MAVYVATHKKFNQEIPKNYLPLLVGAYKNTGEDNYIKDNTGDNISIKNENYCELTGLYWIWKNSKEKIVGLAHYRRYIVKKWGVNTFDNYLSQGDIDRYLLKYDLICPKKSTFKKSVYEQYKDEHYIKDLDLCRTVIGKKYPDYIKSFDKIMSDNEYYAYNMFIGKKEYLDDYFEWLFTILFEVEKQTNISNYDAYQKRIYGFLSERLFNIWIHKNQAKVKSLPYINTEENLKLTNIVYYLYKYKCKFIVKCNKGK